MQYILWKYRCFVAKKGHFQLYTVVSNFLLYSKISITIVEVVDYSMLHMLAITHQMQAKID